MHPSLTAHHHHWTSVFIIDFVIAKLMIDAKMMHAQFDFATITIPAAIITVSCAPFVVDIVAYDF